MSTNPYLSLTTLAGLSSLLDSNKMMVVVDPGDGQGSSTTVGSISLPDFRDNYLLVDVNAAITSLQNKPGNGAFVTPITMSFTGVVVGSVTFDGTSNVSAAMTMPDNSIPISAVEDLASTITALENAAGPAVSLNSSYYSNLNGTQTTVLGYWNPSSTGLGGSESQYGTILQLSSDGALAPSASNYVNQLMLGADGTLTWRQNVNNTAWNIVNLWHSGNFDPSGYAQLGSNPSFAGATLTAALTGTSASFSGTVVSGTSSGVLAVGAQTTGNASIFFKNDGTMASAVGGTPGTYHLIWNAGNFDPSSKLDVAALSSDLTLAADLLPDVDNIRSLGSPTLMWKDIYVGPGSLYVNGQKVLQDNGTGTILVTADPGQNISIQTGGAGDIELAPQGTGNVQIKGTLEINSAFQVLSSDGNAIEFGDSITFVAGKGISGSLAVSGAFSANNFTGSSSGTNTGDQTSISGNAETATKLATPVAINGVDFDGSAPITISAAVTLAGINSALASGNGPIIQTESYSTAAQNITNGVMINQSTVVVTDNSTAANGVVSSAVFDRFGYPTLAATNADVTYTNAYTVFIGGAPFAGSNVIITNPWALYVNSGNTYLGGGLQVSGSVGIGTVPTAVPGTGNPVVGANNLVMYNAGDLGLTMLTDNAATRTQQIGFGSQGISLFDAGMKWDNTSRGLGFWSGGAQHALLDVSGNLTLSGNIILPNGAGIQSVLGGKLSTGPGGDSWIVQPADNSGNAFVIADYTGTAQWTWDLNQNLTTTKTITAGNYSTASYGTADLNTALTTGFHRVDVSTANNPGFDYGQLIVAQNADTVLQIGGDYTSTNLFFRSGNPPPVGTGSWGAWRTIWHNGNLTPGNYALLSGAAFGGGISFGSVVASSSTDFSKHIALYGSSYGFCITGNTLNLVAGNTVYAFTNTGLTAPGTLTVNCTGNADTFTVLTPGNTAAGSSVTITSPGSIPGIVGNNGGSYRSDIKFGSGQITFAVSGGSGGVGDNFTFTSAGNFTAAGTVTGNRIVLGYDSGVANSINTTDWLRSSGNVGWYSASYGGGVYMIDGTYVRAYNGKAFAASDFVVTSDKNQKKHIRDLEYRGRLIPRSFTMRETNKGSFGFVAQEVRKLYPEAVSDWNTAGEKYLSVSYNLLTAVIAHQVNTVEDDLAAAVKLIQKQQEQIDALQSTMKKLAASVTRLH